MGLAVATGMLVASFAWAEDPAAAGKTTATKEAAPAKETATAKPATPTATADEVAVMETSKGRMVIEFWDKDAPQTVANFKKLARQGFYDGTGFHRIIKGFMIQGGDPKSKNPKAPDLGTGDPGYKIKDEFNAHKHVAGVISMANSGTPNSAGSQFFLMHGPASFLDGKYTAFGHVIDGMSVLNEIALTPVGPNPMMGGEQSKPLEWTTLKSVKIMPRAQAMTKTTAEKPAAGATTKPAAEKSTTTTTTTTAKGTETSTKEAPKETPKEAAPPDTTKK
jgi:peptidyl-prolyl cis-trans isomerase B (cyclophilin B)